MTCDIPFLFYGVNTAYYIQGERFCQIDADFLKKIRPLVVQNRKSGLSFQIGRNTLSDFYYSVLPRIRDVVDVVEEDGDEIVRYLPPEAEFVFYLDAENDNITCKPHVRYGEEEFPLLEEEGGNGNVPREEQKEQEVLFLLRQWFPLVDSEKQEFHCGKDEESMYQVLAKGVDALMNMGEVQCTRRFSNLKITKKLRMSVGVSVSNGLLNLDIGTEDLPMEELLEILR